MKRALTVLLLCLAVGPAAATIDPFYRNRMESGIRAFEQGDLEEAEHQLRIACFGYLEDPAALVEGLVRLAIVEALLGDDAAFEAIFSRLDELEQRFAAYSSARLPEPLRKRFEGQAAHLIPVRTLRAIAGFQAIAHRADLQRIAGLPPDRRREELESRIQAEPERVDWLLEMVRLELAVRRPQAALDRLDRLPAETAALPPATCLRQQAATESGSCESMDLAQPFCRDVPADVAEFRLECLVEAARWPEAASLLEGLGPELRARRKVTRLERRVRDNLDPAIEVTAEALPPASPIAVEVPAPTPADPPQAPTAPVADPPQLEGLRDRLASSETAEQLAALRSAADDLTERFPDSRGARLLVAEIAYLQADWQAAVRQFDLAGELRADETHLVFYRAVALYESGDRAAAATVLRPVASKLERTSFVAAYLDRILAP